MLHEHEASGLEHLQLVTTLLQSARVANFGGGVWEAADLQWWWRRDQHADPSASTFWIDDDGRPSAAVVFTDWGDRLGLDLLDARHDSASAIRVAWPRALELLAARATATVEMTIRDGDEPMIAAATAAGFVATDDADVTTRMDATERPAVPDLPDGFVLASRADRADRPHHLVSRSGADVEARLQQCSLYRLELDLCVVDTRTDAVVSYGVFWNDPVTGLGLVEPMRTEDEFQRRGLARVVLASGLERLAARGSRVLCVTYHVGNDASRPLYLGAGFRANNSCRVYGRAPTV